MKGLKSGKSNHHTYFARSNSMTLKIATGSCQVQCILKNKIFCEYQLISLIWINRFLKCSRILTLFQAVILSFNFSKICERTGTKLTGNI